MQDYYKKNRNNLEQALNELIVSKLANKVNIICPKIKIVLTKDNKYRVLSYNLNKLGEFKTASEYLLKEYSSGSFISLFNIWHSFESQFSDSFYLMNQVIKMYLFDFFISYFDRHCYNWGFININGINTIAILDNEDSFNNKYKSIITNELDIDTYRYKLNHANDKNKDELKKFLIESSDEYMLMFQEYLTILNPNCFEEILNKIKENDYILDEKTNEHIKIVFDDNEVERYKDNYYILYSIYKEINKNNKKRIKKN